MQTSLKFTFSKEVIEILNKGAKNSNAFNSALAAVRSSLFIYGAAAADYTQHERFCFDCMLSKIERLLTLCHAPGANLWEITNEVLYFTYTPKNNSRFSDMEILSLIFESVLYWQRRGESDSVINVGGCISALQLLEWVQGVITTIQDCHTEYNNTKGGTPNE